MRHVILEHSPLPDLPATERAVYDDVFARLRAVDPQARFAVVKLSPEASSQADGTGGWQWLALAQHDIEGALRSFRYLADKVAATYDADDARGRKVLETIARHLATMETLRHELLAPLHAAGSATTSTDKTP